jgi:hypothetical protein
VDDTHLLVKRDYMEEIKDLLQDEVSKCGVHCSAFLGKADQGG